MAQRPAGTATKKPAPKVGARMSRGEIDPNETEDQRREREAREADDPTGGSDYDPTEEDEDGSKANARAEERGLKMQTGKGETPNENRQAGIKPARTAEQVNRDYADKLAENLAKEVELSRKIAQIANELPTGTVGLQPSGIERVSDAAPMQTLAEEIAVMSAAEKITMGDPNLHKNDQPDDPMQPPREKQKSTGGVKVRLLRAYKREDLTMLTPGMVFEATPDELKRLVNLGAATIADDDAELSDLPEPEAY
jgi:hypothetical protein